MNAANNKNRPLQMINQTDVRPLTGYFTHDRIAVPNPLPEAPERPERLDVIERNMLALGMDALVRVHYAKPAPIESVILAHDLEYVRRLEAASAGDPAALATFDAPDTRVGPDTFDAAMKSAGAVVEAVRLATALEIYVSGSLNVFNHETNVDLNRRLVCLDLKKLGAGLRTIAMLIMQDLVNSQVSMNFLRGIATWCYFDEFHVLLRDRLTASYCVAIWKMLRKKGCVPSALTQNVKDFLASPEIENIFENSDFLVLLSQAQGDRQILAKQLGISPHQLSYVTHTNSGEGLLFFGNTTIPFVDRFPQNTELYAIMTTRPEDKKQEMNRA